MSPTLNAVRYQINEAHKSSFVEFNDFFGYLAKINIASIAELFW